MWQKATYFNDNETAEKILIHYTIAKNRGQHTPPAASAFSADTGARQSPGLSERIIQILSIQKQEQPPLLGHPCTGGIRVPRPRPDRSPAQRERQSGGLSRFYSQLRRLRRRKWKHSVRSGKEEQRSERTGGAKKRRRKRYGACDDVVVRLTGFVCISAHSRNKGCAVGDASARQSPGLSEWIFQILPVKLRQQPPAGGGCCRGAPDRI